ncbi:MAG: diguanylate cyclase [Planctomycetes bacterium]|nr:diguanylate cyclase [Planctomycetota bacterium]
MSHETDDTADPASGASGRILIVEDDRHSLITLTKRLERSGYEVHVARDGQEGLELALELNPDVILSDWMMPRMDGITMCRSIRENQALEGVYVIILSNKHETAERVKGIDEGADDYLAKDCAGEELSARIRSGMRIRRLQRELIRRAQVDGLTDLWNRTHLFERLDQELRRSQRYRQPITACMIDMDDFKEINDGLGHLAGDAALRHVARILRHNCRDTDVIARFGGDEFAVIFINAGEETARGVIDRIVHDVEMKDLVYQDRPIRIGLSWGLHEADLDAQPAPDAVIAAADHALYQMKRARSALRPD